MLELPYINTRLHISHIMKHYDDFADAYNADIENKRSNDPENKTNYQTLKPTHRELFNDLVMELGKNMLHAIKLYEKLQKEQGDSTVFQLKRNGICGDGYYTCSTNRYQMAKHNRKEVSTIGRNIRRLMEAGIITGKTNHGHFSDFDLQLNASFVLVSDKANPAYNPLDMGETRAFSTSPKNAECKAEEKEKEHLINKIYSVVPTDLITTGSENQPTTTGTITGTTGKVQPETNTNTAQRSFKPTGGVADIQHMKAERGYDWRLSKQNPAHWHAFHRLSYSAYFIDYLIERIYNHRGIEIIPEARIAVIEYAERYYFPSPMATDEHVKTPFHPCQTIDDYANRLSGLKWCIDAANRFAAKRGTFFVLPNKYIDIENVNGLVGTLKWYKEARQNEKDKAVGLKNIKDLKNLHAQIRLVVENPDIENFRTAETYIQNNLMKYVGVFHASLATIKKRF